MQLWGDSLEKWSFYEVVDWEWRKQHHTIAIYRRQATGNLILKLKSTTRRPAFKVRLSVLKDWFWKTQRMQAQRIGESCGQPDQWLQQCFTRNNIADVVSRVKTAFQCETDIYAINFKLKAETTGLG